ncbi:MAG TPA: sugar phosphate isomerase/epimerase family protein [Vicinamibacterales bacterium]|nr:sugar phosphate isomerase/epimerase family protein [Vicinamibacterales bacterium]
MKLGVNMFIWTAEFSAAHLDMLPRIKEHGFDGIEIPLFDPANFPAARIREGLAAYGLECTVCSIIPEGKSLISEDAGVRKRTRQHLRDTIQAAADAGATLVDGPLYCPVRYLPGRRRTLDEWLWTIEGYQSVTETLDACNVTLAIEPLNRFETYFLNTAADAAALCDEVRHPRVGVAFDTFHANIEEKNLPDACRRIGSHLKHVQISENDRGTPGSGHTDWMGILRALREIGYDAWLTIESFGPSLGAFSAAVAIWRDIEPTPDRIAFDGVKFLRQALASLG